MYNALDVIEIAFVIVLYVSFVFLSFLYCLLNFNSIIH